MMTELSSKLWQDSPHDIIQFDDLIIPDEVDEAVLEVLCDGSISQHLLLYGPAGTGKTAACRAIAAARTNSQSLTELRQRVNILPKTATISLHRRVTLCVISLWALGLSDLN